MSDFTTKKEDNKSLKKERIRMNSISFIDGESDGILFIVGKTLINLFLREL